MPLIIMTLNRLAICLLCITLLALNHVVTGQSQIGSFYGTGSNDWCGYSVSMPDGYIVAIGSPNNDGGGTNAGQVRIYSWGGNNWSQKGNSLYGEASLDWSGSSVCMPDANTIAIGAYGNDDGGTESGHVRIYRWNGFAWVIKGSDIDGESPFDKSGNAVSMPDANTVAIGAAENDGSGTNSGHVRVYSWNGNSWTQKGVDINGESANDFSGCSVSMPDSNTVAIGAFGNDGAGSDAGHVRIYRWNGSIWTQKGGDIDGEAANDKFGFSVCMPNSNTVAVGAYLNDGVGTDAGHVRVYTWNGASWVQMGSDVDGETTNDWSGWSLDMPDSNTLVIGARQNGGAAYKAGHARIYKWDGSNWDQYGSDIDGSAANDNFGFSVCMPDTNTVAVGTIGFDGNKIDAGRVDIYSLCSRSSSNVTINACNSYILPSGNDTLNVSGWYTDVIPNTTGCDSLIYINLKIKTVNVAVKSSSPLLIAQASSAKYQWLDCNNAMAIIPGDTGQSFTATTNGNYAVEITKNDCVDTSDCIAVTNVGLNENVFGKELLVYPNPTDGVSIIELGQVFHDVRVTVRNSLGKLVSKQQFENSDTVEIEILGESGLYTLEINADGKKEVLKVIK